MTPCHYCVSFVAYSNDAPYSQDEFDSTPRQGDIFWVMLCQHIQHLAVVFEFQRQSAQPFQDLSTLLPFSFIIALCFRHCILDIQNGRASGKETLHLFITSKCLCEIFDCFRISLVGDVADTAKY